MMDVSQILTLHDALPATETPQSMKDDYDSNPVCHVEVLRNPFR